MMEEEEGKLKTKGSELNKKKTKIEGDRRMVQ